MSSRTLMALAPVLLLAGACASDGPRGRRGPEAPRPVAEAEVAEPVALMLAGLDSNGDTVVDRSELSAGAARAFRAADADRSGEVSLIELANWSRAWLGSTSARPGRFDFDRDQSDSISAGEMAAEFMRRFARLDTDRDDRLQRSELLTLARVTRAGEAAGPDRQRQPNPGSP
jgi:hypothetical protein